MHGSIAQLDSIEAGNLHRHLGEPVDYCITKKESLVGLVPCAVVCAFRSLGLGHLTSGPRAWTFP